LPDVEVFESAMRAAGVYDARPVVVYDDWQGRAAARCWWLLRWAGHPDVRVLDGGWSAWVAAGGVVSTSLDHQATSLDHQETSLDHQETSLGPREASLDHQEVGDFTARPGQLPALEVDEVLAFAERGVLVDARNPERYTGEVEPVDPVAGHIPGAVNVPTGANLRDDGTFKSPEELREVYAAARDREAAAYCGSGVTAAHDLLAMAVAGIDGALYPGSWSEWVADPGRPVATGADRPTSGRP
jgi:thiosulfate/3-mercaptopyruvate sulfurtransferase